MKTIATKLVLCILTVLLALPVYAQSGVGKLSGKVTDAVTGEALIGANVLISNTNLGAATNPDGEYFILNVPPGTYEVKSSYVGYAPKAVREIRVVAGITYELDIQLTTDFSLPEVIVQEKKFFEEKSTNTTKVFDSEQIGRLPVRGIEKLASLQAGVVIQEGSGGETGNAVINVRGGRGNEVLYIVDGVPQNDVYSGENYSQVSSSAIEQLSFQIGGYEAKYGQAQSGIVNVTTKSGDPSYSLYADVMTSQFTDVYGSNEYTLNFSGPIIPGNSNHTIFLSAERGWYLDANPSAIGVSFNSDKVFSSDYLPGNSSGVWRFTGRTNHSLGDFNLRLGANINVRNYQNFALSYAKNNSEHNDLTKEGNYSYSARISQNINNNSFWNINLGYKYYNYEDGDGVWFDNLYAYGDSALNASAGAGYFADGEWHDGFPANGQRLTVDDVGIFYAKGRTYGSYSKRETQTLNIDADLTAQIDNHLIEIGGGANYNILRNFILYSPYRLSSDNLSGLSPEAQFYSVQPTVFGYDITGNDYASSDGFTDLYQTKEDQSKNKLKSTQTSFAPKKPIIAYLYVQDRFELSDLVINVGLRADYMDTQEDVIKDPTLPFAGGTNKNDYDAGDFIRKKSEFYLSPRIGLGFPITATTVFHAQFGKFIQQPSLDNLYFSPFDLKTIISDSRLLLNVGQLNSEVTTQYEIGFRQVLGNIAGLNITAFYKNTKGLINIAPVYFQRALGGETLNYYTPTNTDFGTIKGLSLSIDVTRVSYFGLSVNYTYALSEGTGSSTSSSYVAAFRNAGNEIPKVIAPLDFDQRHTGTINLDFYIPKDDLGIFEMLNANVLISFNSGRPYTPLAVQQILANGDNTQYGDTRGYVNSAYGPGNFRIDLKMEKSFELSNSLLITPYVWIQNLLDADNPVVVYRSTGDPYSTGWLNTKDAKDAIAGKGTPGGQYYMEDYKSLERNPSNFGIPRLIRLGVKLNFSNI